MTKFIVNTEQTHERLASIFFLRTSCQIVRSPSLLHHINYTSVSVRLLTTKISQWARENFCSYRKTLYCSNISGKARKERNTCGQSRACKCNMWRHTPESKKASKTNKQTITTSLLNKINILLSVQTYRGQKEPRKINWFTQTWWEFMIMEKLINYFLKD